MSKTVKMPKFLDRSAMIAAALAGGALMAVSALPAQAAQRLEVARNNMVRVTLPAQAGSVVVGNPNIADVNVVDSHTLFIIGRGFGSSAVSVVDRTGRTIFDSQVIVTAGQRDSVMVYKGTKPSLMVCSNVCTAADDESTAGGQNAPVSATFAPSAPVSMPVSSAPATPGAAVALQQ